MSKAETHRFNVFTDDSDTIRTVGAAYFVHEDEFTVFKAEDGKILASFANRHIVGIERESEVEIARNVKVRLTADVRDFA